MSDGTRTLIDDMVRSLAPVRRVPRLRVVGSCVLALGIVLALGGLALWGLRDDVRSLSMSGRYVVALASLWAFVVGGVLAALGSSIPGREAVLRLGLAFMGVAALGSGLAAVLFAVYATSAAASGPGSLAGLLGIGCLLRAGAVALPPALMLTYFVSRAFPQRVWFTAASTAVGLAAFGALPATMACPTSDIVHVLFAHVLAPWTVGIAVFVLILGALRCLRGAWLA